jgi:hypothetical protein
MRNHQKAQVQVHARFLDESGYCQTDWLCVRSSNVCSCFQTPFTNPKAVAIRSQNRHESLTLPYTRQLGLQRSVSRPWLYIRWHILVIGFETGSMWLDVTVTAHYF